MVKFCNLCRNIMAFDNYGKFKCNVCSSILTLTADDTLITEERAIDPLNMYAQLAYGTPLDPAAAISTKLCNKCNQYKKVMHLGVNERTEYVCKCIYNN